MVVGAEHIDGHVGRVFGAVALVPVVGDVGGEVGELAVGLDDHAVLVVTMLGGFEPSGAVLVVDIAVRFELFDGGFDLLVGVEAVLVEPDVEVHAEVLHGLLNLVEHHRHCALAEFLAHFGVVLAERFTVIVQALILVGQRGQVHAVGLGFGFDAGGDFVDIGALVAVARGFGLVTGAAKLVGLGPGGDQ